MSAAETGHRLPGAAGGETDTLLAFLGYLRAAVRAKLDGLSDDDVRRPLVPSGTTLLGLLKHLAVVEEYWSRRRLLGETVESDDGFALSDTDTVSSVRARYAEASRHTDEVVRGCASLDRPLARSSHGLTARWMLVHLVEETARHAGHADILRELIDGRTGL